MKSYELLRLILENPDAELSDGVTLIRDAYMSSSQLVLSTKETLHNKGSATLKPLTSEADVPKDFFGYAHRPAEVVLDEGVDPVFPTKGVCDLLLTALDMITKRVQFVRNINPNGLVVDTYGKTLVIDTDPNGLAIILGNKIEVDGFTADEEKSIDDSLEIAAEQRAFKRFSDLVRSTLDHPMDGPKAENLGEACARYANDPARELGKPAAILGGAAGGIVGGAAIAGGGLLRRKADAHAFNERAREAQ
jgi:hypothetical protein